MPDKTNELEQFIYQKCYDHIWGAVSEHVSAHPNSLELQYSRVQYPDSAMLEDMMLEFSTNISVDEDTLSFDAVVSCTIELQQDTYHDVETAEANQWFKVFCSVLVEDKIKKFTVHEISPYTRGNRNITSGVAATNNIVPLIRKDQLDMEATRFLERYYPEALSVPMAVPIEQIVQDKMGLTLLQGKRITNDFSLFGQICFSAGTVHVYDILDNQYHEVEVQRGTIIIDAYTYWARNIGCVNNTIAHEAYHWHRHRIYAAIKSILRGEKLIACRCPSAPINDNGKKVWTDEESMEWQASHVAPRILMPIETVKTKIDELYQKYEFHANKSLQTEILECVIDELADFYKVSKQSAKIRMIDLGYAEAAGVYNFDNSVTPYFSNINPRDAFYEYSDNSEFHKVIDSGLFVYTEGYFVINDAKYVECGSDGVYSLTDYAWNNLAECTLQFTYRRVNIQEHGRFHADAFHRTNANAYEQLPSYDTDRNVSIISNAEVLRKKRDEFESQYSEHKALTKTFWQRAYEIMEARHWNSTIFCEKTLLNEITYSRAKNNFDSLPDIRTVMAICAGLDLDIGLTNELLSLAGHTLSNSREHQAFGFVITSYRGKSIHERNEFLESLEMTPLGSKQRQ